MEVGIFYVKGSVPNPRIQGGIMEARVTMQNFIFLDNLLSWLKSKIGLKPTPSLLFELGNSGNKTLFLWDSMELL